MTQLLPSNRPDDLPEFSDPPVIEVVLSVQFAELRDYKAVHAGLLWSRLKTRGYSTFSEHGTLDDRFEVFGTQMSQAPEIKFEALQGVPPLRVWYIGAAGNELIQVQPSRFLRNWRKIGEADEYPRYEAIRSRFFADVADFSSFLKAEGLGDIQPNQCEVTYINIIRHKGDAWARSHEIFRGIAAVTSEAAGERLPPLEGIQFISRYVLSEGGEAIGRLFASCLPAVATDNGEKVLRLELTARGAPLRHDMEGVQRFFDFGREAIVRGFAALTTPELHSVWGRKP